jgi:cellulose synthase (UDP-forming)
LNGTLIASLPSPSKTADIQDALAATISLPAELLVRSNVLGFQFIGHYTRDCEDPANTVLWARVEPNSTVELSGSLLPLSDDLKILPLPFYDDELKDAYTAVPFVFAEQPSLPSLQAAGILASWFGVLAKTHLLTVPVKVTNTLPPGNVVVFIERPSDAPQGLNLDIDGPTIAVRTNPSDSYGKVLVIAGNDATQLVTAARALALQNTILQGRTARITNFDLPAPREADDAPLWLRTDRISPLWNYSDNAELQSDGSGPLPVYLRLPPDLYYGDRSAVPLSIDYRYNAIPLSNGSTLRVTANGTLVNELPLPHADNPKKSLSYTAAVPITSLRPFANTFLFNFYFQIAKTGHCEDTPPINLQGAVLRSSHLDLRGLDHWAAMPNLELFANAGFPFTRFADLAQTMVVMPAAPSEKEIGLYLTLMTYFAGQTGYPALRLNVGDASGLGKDLDYLVIGTSSDQAAFDHLGDQLHVAIKSNQITVTDTGGFFSSMKHTWWQVAEMRPHWWWKVGVTKERDGLISSLGESPDAVLQGIESPWESRRSVVTITLKNDDAASAFVSAFLASYSSGSISESVSVLHGKDFSSYRLGDRLYYVGYLPWWSHVRYWLREFPWMVVLLTFVLGLFVVPWTRSRLDRRARARLEAREA